MIPDLPPIQFDHPYTGTLIVERVPAHETDKRCGSVMGIRYFVNACSFASPDGRRCRIIFPAEPNPYTPQFIDALWRHEIGHCNGWRH